MRDPSTGVEEICAVTPGRRRVHVRPNPVPCAQSTTVDAGRPERAVVGAVVVFVVVVDDLARDRVFSFEPRITNLITLPSRGRARIVSHFSRSLVE